MYKAFIPVQLRRKQEKNLLIYSFSLFSFLSMSKLFESLVEIDIRIESRLHFIDIYDDLHQCAKMLYCKYYFGIQEIV